MGDIKNVIIDFVLDYILYFLYRWSYNLSSYNLKMMIVLIN